MIREPWPATPPRGPALWNPYSPEAHPKYDHCDAIHVNKTKEIPKDYAGIMGVPMPFLDKRNPEQFDIIGAKEEAFQQVLARRKWVRRKSGSTARKRTSDYASATGGYRGLATFRYNPQGSHRAEFP